MFNLRTLGKEFHKFATAKRNRTQSRAFTPEEEQQLLEALEDITNIDGIQLVLNQNHQYDSVEALRLDVVCNGRFVTPVLSCPGIMTDHTYTLYRMYHDIRNHVLQSKSFSPFDELLSAFDLFFALRGKVSQYTLDFIFTDVLLMNAVYAHSPKKWHQLENGTHHRVCCLSTFEASKLLKDSPN